MKRASLPRLGFSLIELTVVIAIIAILLTISAGAFVRYYLNARLRATESVLQILDGELGQRVESFWKNVNPPTRLRHSFLSGLAPAATATNETTPIRLRRSRLLAKLEAMRGDFPQQFADFLPGVSGGLASNTDATYSDNSAPVASRARAAIEAEYRRLTYERNPTAVPNNAPRGTAGYNQITQIAPHDHQTESAACLYLMLKVGSGDGRAFDMASIPPGNIRDTDDDGVPELVDSWGTPLRFYRWPTDLIYTLTNVNEQVGGRLNVLDAGNSNNQNTLDPERLLYTTPWTASTQSQIVERNATAATAGYGNFFRLTDPTVGNRTPFSFPLYPVIVSAGPDAFDLPREDKWQAFGLIWGQDFTTVPAAPITTSYPPVNELDTRMGRVSQDWAPPPALPSGYTSYPGAGAHVDNIVSRVIVAGREAQ